MAPNDHPTTAYYASAPPYGDPAPRATSHTAWSALRCWFRSLLPSEQWMYAPGHRNGANGPKGERDGDWCGDCGAELERFIMQCDDCGMNAGAWSRACRVTGNQDGHVLRSVSRLS